MTKKIILPKGKFSVILADPPWKFVAGTKGRPQHYKRMTLDQIKAMTVQAKAKDDCWLFLWTTGPHLPQALEVIKAWGFRYSGMGFVWIKMNQNASPVWFPSWGEPGLRKAWPEDQLFMGGGYTTRKNAEFCLLASRGSPKRLSRKVHEIIISPRREHSRKPDEAYERIEQFCKGPRLELFARTQRKGWKSWGNQTRKFK